MTMLLEYYAVTCAIAVFTFFCGWKARGRPRVVVLRPSTAQWALLASLSSSQRTIARLKMLLTRAEEANHDLRERLEAAQRNLSPRN